MKSIKMFVKIACGTGSVCNNPGEAHLSYLWHTSQPGRGSSATTRARLEVPSRRRIRLVDNMPTFFLIKGGFLFCISTTPIMVFAAFVSIVKGSSMFGKGNTGSVIITVSNCSNATLVFVVHLNASFSVVTR